MLQNGKELVLLCQTYDLKRVLSTNKHFEPKWRKQFSTRTPKLTRMLKTEGGVEQHCNLGKSKVESLMISVVFSSISLQLSIFFLSWNSPFSCLLCDSAFVWLSFSLKSLSPVVLPTPLFSHSSKLAVPWGSSFSSLLPVEAFFWEFY